MKKIDEINQSDSLTYQITWYTSRHQEECVEKVADDIRKLLPSLCMAIKIDLREVEVTPYYTTITLSADDQVNMSKTAKTLQKLLIQSLDKECKALKIAGCHFWDSTFLMTTKSTGVAKANTRIEKVLNALWAVEYYDIDESFTSYIDESFTSDIDRFKRYLANRPIGIIEYDNNVFFIDKEALNQVINLNCFECTKIYKYGCCCGSPCDMSSKNKKMFDRHSLSIAEEVKKLDEDHYKQIVSSGGFLDREGSIKEYQGRCSLLVEHEGVRKCIAHKYALDKHIPIYDICPLSCLMYPLEIMELITNKQKTIIFLTSVLDEDFAKEFGRWGSYKSLDVDLRCLDKKAHNEVFKEKDYKPVYEVNKNLLIHEFGMQIYKGIEQLYQINN